MRKKDLSKRLRELKQLNWWQSGMSFVPSSYVVGIDPYMSNGNGSLSIVKRHQNTITVFEYIEWMKQYYGQ